MKSNHKIEVDPFLLDYLKQPAREMKDSPGKRWSRLEAYCDLVNKAIGGFVSKSVMLEDFEFQTTISALAVEWSWHRVTVRSFLRSLELYGQIRRVKYGRSETIKMLRMDKVEPQTEMKTM